MAIRESKVIYTNRSLSLPHAHSMAPVAHIFKMLPIIGNVMPSILLLLSLNFLHVSHHNNNRTIIYSLRTFDRCWGLNEKLQNYTFYHEQRAKSRSVSSVSFTVGLTSLSSFKRSNKNETQMNMRIKYLFSKERMRRRYSYILFYCLLVFSRWYISLHSLKNRNVHTSEAGDTPFSSADCVHVMAMAAPPPTLVMLHWLRAVNEYFIYKPAEGTETRRLRDNSACYPQWLLFCAAFYCLAFFSHMMPANHTRRKPRHFYFVFHFPDVRLYASVCRQTKINSNSGAPQIRWLDGAYRTLSINPIQYAFIVHWT